MDIISLEPRPELEEDTKISQLYRQFEQLLEELSTRGMPEEIAASINRDIDELNAIASSDSRLKKKLKKKQSGIIKLIEKELNLVPKSYYRNIWLLLGMAAFGLPLGVVFGSALDNMALLGIGLPLGLAMGLAVGNNLDKKAAEEGRQLDIEINY